MKKRKSSSWTQITKDFSTSKIFPSKSRIQNDVKISKRIRQSAVNAKSTTLNEENYNNNNNKDFSKKGISESSSKRKKITNSYQRKDIFHSLESLFNIQKPLKVQEIVLADEPFQYLEGNFFSSGDTSPKLHFIPKLNFATSWGVNEIERNLSNFQEVEKDNYSPSHFKTLNTEMSAEQLDTLDQENETKEDTTEQGGDTAESIEADENEELAKKEEEEERFLTTVVEEESGKGDKQDEGALEDVANKFSIPSGLGEGVPIKPGGRKESTMSSIPLTDTAVMKELKEAEERCSIIDKEIQQLKKELVELTNKETLTMEDTKKIEEKQETVMEKLGEFEQMTRKLQRLLGLADPSSHTFAKMFGMLPYPHTKLHPSMAKVDEIEETKGMGKARKKIEDEEDALFDLPQVQYPEDKLPRVIICGHTEDNIPKVVIAESEGRQFPQTKDTFFGNLTGKLCESLTMQEKLAHENAKLEGGKYKLEEALLEKDTVVETLERKVCGLQAEMRIVVKENTELSRQLATLNEKIQTQENCYSPLTPSSPRFPSSSRNEQKDPCCYCYNHSSSRQQTTTCDPNYSSYSKSLPNSPRLAGGASKGSCSINQRMSLTSPSRNVPCEIETVLCPAELENKLNVYGSSTKQLEQQLGSIESEVRNMQMELANVQRERQQLEQQRKLLKCTGPCAPCSCCPPSPLMQTTTCINTTILEPPKIPSVQRQQQQQQQQLQGSNSCAGPCTLAPMGTSSCTQQQLRDLREQYARLQDDYKSKLCEVSCLRTETDKMRQEMRQAKEEKERSEIQLCDLQERLQAFENEKEKLQGSKEQMIEQEQALVVAKQRFREAQDELEELRSLIQDQAAQLEDYRNKYLQAQQQVEEQRRQLDLMEIDNARMNENVTLEIGRVKNQFQEKLAELAPLPDLLKQTQVKLQETQQFRLMAEKNCEELSRELISFKEKFQTLENQVDLLRTENQNLQEERDQMAMKYEEMERKSGELRNENERMKNSLARSQEQQNQLQKRIDEKLHEIAQLAATLEQVREDSARQVARTKERCDTIRRSMQGQISELEMQLAQCRATARAAQKDRDEIRQKMQGQINNLNEAFEQAQGRIRSLQGHVNYLKNSYSNIFKSPQGPAELPPGDFNNQGFDSCDCNY